MLQQLSRKLLLSPADVTPTNSSMKVLGVFNPGVARYKNKVKLLVRVAEQEKKEEPGYVLSLRAPLTGNHEHYVVERFKIKDASDQRKPVLEGGIRRLSFISHLEIVTLDESGMNVESIEKHPDLFPQKSYEEFGLEDPRITLIDETYYITYVGVSREMSICTGLLSTTDFKRFRRHGIIFDADTKDVVLFPAMIHGKYQALIRPTASLNVRKPAILAAASPDLLHWGEYQFVMGCRSGLWDQDKIGPGVPPIHTPHGWLHIYHGVQRFPDNPIGTYQAGVFLTAPHDPSVVIARPEPPFFVPETDYEQQGYINNVVFPTGAVQDSKNNNQLLVYYGAADSRIGVIVFSLSDIINNCLT